MNHQPSPRKRTMKHTVGRTLIAVAAFNATLGIGAGIASAHVPHIRLVNAGCGGIRVTAKDYPPGPNSSVTVEYDGNIAYQQTFGPDLPKHTVPNPDTSIAHTYRVTFDRFNFEGDDGDKVYTGEIPRCTDAPPVPTTTTVTQSSTAVATTVPCQEDQPCWDCATMGNHICGPTTTIAVSPPVPPAPGPSAGPPPALPATGLGNGTELLAALILLVGCTAVYLAKRPHHG